METKFGVEVTRDGGRVACFEGAHQASYPSEQRPVAITWGCELGEHCRCKTFDASYKADCWNWVGV